MADYKSIDQYIVYKPADTGRLGKNAKNTVQNKRSKISFKSLTSDFITKIVSENMSYSSLMYCVDIMLSDPDEFDELLEYLGLDGYPGTKYDLLSLINMIPFIGWDAERSSSFIKHDDITYNGLIGYVTGEHDQSVDQYEEHDDQEIYQTTEWLESLEIYDLVDLYTALIIYGSPTNPTHNYLYTPGHILYQLALSIKPDDLLVRFVLKHRVEFDESVYKQLYCNNGHDDNIYLNALSQVVVNKNYIASLYSSKRPKLNKKYNALILCFEQERMDLTNTSIGLNQATKQYVKAHQLKVGDFNFDSICCSRVRINNQVTYIANKFPSEESIRLFDGIENKYELIIFEHCSGEGFFTKESIEMFYRLLKPGGTMVAKDMKYVSAEINSLLLSLFHQIMTPTHRFGSEKAHFNYYTKLVIS